MFELSEEWKLRVEGSNPCRGVKHYAENKVERFLSGTRLERGLQRSRHLGQYGGPEILSFHPCSFCHPRRNELARLGAALAAAERGSLLVNGAEEPSPQTKRKRGGQRKTGPRSEHPSVIAAIRLLLLTGCRVGEILNLKWSATAMIPTATYSNSDRLAKVRG
jgi:integrase